MNKRLYKEILPILYPLAGMVFVGTILYTVRYRFNFNRSENQKLSPKELALKASLQ